MPDNRWDRGDVEVNFGALPALPEGYSVWWHELIEMYMAHGPGYESAITCNRFQARRWCFAYAVGEPTPEPTDEEA